MNSIKNIKTSSPVYGLVLAGGKSTRMGRDKSIIEYHGRPQREYLYELLDQVCDKTFLSIRPEQQGEFGANISFIVDEDQYGGPYNGLLSAHHLYPSVTWLVLACDLPLMNLKGIKQLIAARNPRKMATAFATRENSLPEPLAALWEPKGLNQSEEFLNNGTSTCPRKYLMNSSVELVFPKDKMILLNANSQVEYEEALIKLNLH